MKKIFILGCLAIASLTASADVANVNDGKVINVDSIAEAIDIEKDIQRLTPEYMPNYYTTDLLSNWFAGIQGGGLCFIGSPNGCGDMFDRASFAYNAFIGKWHNPTIGTRLVYQGGKFNDLHLGSQNFYAVHADLMYNVINHLNVKNKLAQKWDVIPNVGVGLIHGPKHSNENCTCGLCNGRNLGFMLSYGVQGRYKATDRLYVTAELGGISTFGDFDSRGFRNKFGDSMLSLSLGMSVNIGKNGYKHPIDALPYMAQNDYLIRKQEDYRNATLALSNQHKMDANTLKKLHAALEAEGLIDRYGCLFGDKARDERSYYDGLLSLRSRMKDARQPAVSATANVSFHSGDSILNAPVYFFFKKGRAKLTDNSQLVNLDEIARVAKEKNLVLRIDGAADKATGSAEKNKELSRMRCLFIREQLSMRGIEDGKMKLFWHGGVSKHSRKEEDRNSKVSVWFSDDSK